MSASVSSNTSLNSRRSTGNSRSDGRSNYRSDRVNPHDEFHGIKFVFGRPDQVPIYLQSMKKLGDYAGTKMNNNMYKLVKKKVETTFPKPKAPGKDPAKHVVDECRELMKRKLDKEDKYNEDKAKLFRICQRASCATYGRDPCTLLHERLSTDSARSQTMQRH